MIELSVSMNGLFSEKENIFITAAHIPSTARIRTYNCRILEPCNNKWIYH